MYTIGQVSEMFNLPISTLRYYDKQGLFPEMVRESGIRKFSDTEIEALRVIECLKKSGLEIKDIKQFMDWCAMGASTYSTRKELFEEQKKMVEAEIEHMNRVLDMLKFKCWYYEQALQDGNENRVRSMIPDNLPEEIAVCKSFFSKVLKLLAFQGVWMFLYSQFPLFFPLSGKNKGKSYCTLSSSFAASRLASLLACA